MSPMDLVNSTYSTTEHAWTVRCEPTSMRVQPTNVLRGIGWEWELHGSLKKTCIVDLHSPKGPVDIVGWFDYVISYIHIYNCIYIIIYDCYLYVYLSTCLSFGLDKWWSINQPLFWGTVGVISWGTLSAFLSHWGTWKAPAAIGFPAHRLTARCCRWCYRSGSLSHSDLPTYTMDNPSQKDHYVGSLASRVWSKAQRLGYETKTTSNRTRAKYGKQSFGKISRIESPAISLYTFLSWKHGGKRTSWASSTARF